MDMGDGNTRLNQIATLWSVVRRAHDDPGEAGRAARQALLQRYLGAINRYLLGALRNPDAAQELAQDFAYRFLHGDLRGANPDRGRFRDFVKGVLFHMVIDYHTRRKRDLPNLSDEFPEPGGECSVAAEREQAFLDSWRDELLARTWEALEAWEKEQGQPYYTVLKAKADHQDTPSAQLAEDLSARLGKPITAAGFRKTLERARDRFADLLLEEIAQALDDPSRARLEEELMDLNLLEHCKAALERRSM